MLQLVGAVGASLIANGLTNGLGAGSAPSSPAVAPAGQLGYTLQPQSSAGLDYGYSLANELQPQIEQPIMMPLATMPGLAGLGGAAEQPAPAMPVKKCDTCSGSLDVPSYPVQQNGPMMWAAIGALAGWAGGRGAVKGAIAGYLAALLLGAK